ncbi:MAG: hypothetical protein QOJ13_1483 [Gaiellales bacterium]|jgi:hypothetical protein|nr:hypothetical protein [Gaiellales bacterium]
MEWWSAAAWTASERKNVTDAPAKRLSGEREKVAAELQKRLAGAGRDAPLIGRRGRLIAGSSRAPAPCRPSFRA